MKKKRVLVASNLPREPFKELMDRFEVIFPGERRFSKEELKELLPTIDALIPTYGFKVRPEVIDAAPNLKIIANYGVGYDNIDAEYAAEKGIVVTNNPVPVAEPTAEHTYALMLAVMHRIPESDRDIREGCPDWSEMSYMGHSLFEKTLGIVGLGSIGKKLLKYAAASHMKVLYHNRRRLNELQERELGVRYAEFDELLSHADIVTVHVPLTDDSRHMFGAEAFRKMKKEAYFINAARGAVADEAALVEALREGEIAGAALDVFEFEPKITEGLLKLKNVVLTPHTATNTWEGRYGMSYYSARNVIRFFDGDPDIDRVN